MARYTYDEVTQTLETDEGLGNRDRLRFHAFNPRGAAADWMAACKEIGDAVEAGRLKSGAILAYGSMNDYHWKAIMRLVRVQKPKTFPTDYAIRGLREAAAKARAVARGEEG